MKPEPGKWLENWKRRWEQNARRAHENAYSDSGWSRDVAEACTQAARDLLLDLARRLALVTTTPEDMFDRPELVECMEAARLATGIK